MNADIKNKLDVYIGTYVSNESEEIFTKEIWNISKYIPEGTKYIIISLFMQLGKPDNFYGSVLSYQNKNRIFLAIQPKIKNYITFKCKANMIQYEKEELNEDELYLALEVHNGSIVF